MLDKRSVFPSDTVLNRSHESLDRPSCVVLLGPSVPQRDFLEYSEGGESDAKGFTHVFFNGCLHNFLEPGEALGKAAELLREVSVAVGRTAFRARR